MAGLGGSPSLTGSGRLRSVPKASTVKCCSLETLGGPRQRTDLPTEELRGSVSGTVAPACPPQTEACWLARLPRVHRAAQATVDHLLGKPGS